MQITGVAQSCQSGNQAEFTRRGHVSTDQQKNFIGKNLSRFGKFPIDYNLQFPIQTMPQPAAINTCMRIVLRQMYTLYSFILSQVMNVACIGNYN